MAAIKIDRKIAKYRVQKPGQGAEAEKAAAAPAPAVVETEAPRFNSKGKVIRLTEEVQRPEVLIGSTYKIKTPVSDHAMYVTINDIVLNEGSDHEQRRPFEVFINSKNLDHYQWIVALTRIISAVFRKGGDVTFLVEELKAVFDPRGGQWMEGRYVPSLLAAIGGVIERHLIDIGFIESLSHEPNLECEVCCDDELVVICHPRFPLARHKELTPQKLHNALPTSLVIF